MGAVLHVLYKAINRTLHGAQVEESADEETSTNIIQEETSQMAVH